MKRISVLLAAMCTALVLCASAVAAAKAQAADGQSIAYVDVGVATSWVFPGFDQMVDQPAVSNPSDVTEWLESMSLGQEQRLIGDLETQALYGQRVVILEDQGEWLKVAVDGQPTRTARGDDDSDRRAGYGYHYALDPEVEYVWVGVGEVPN